MHMFWNYYPQHRHEIGRLRNFCQSAKAEGDASTIVLRQVLLFVMFDPSLHAVYASSLISFYLFLHTALSVGAFLYSELPAGGHMLSILPPHLREKALVISPGDYLRPSCLLLRSIHVLPPHTLSYPLALLPSPTIDNRPSVL